MKFAHFVVAIIIQQVAVTSPIYHYKQFTSDEGTLLLHVLLHRLWIVSSGQFEGDMLLTPASRNDVIDTNLRWPNRKIPYKLSNDFSITQKNFIHQTLATEYGKTCIKVRPRRSTDFRYVSVTVGRLTGKQELNLQTNGCVYYGTIPHELLHTVGFYHQQSATERDSYVTIMWQNIIKGQEHNFSKYGTNTYMISSFGEKCDYSSVIDHSGQSTIVPKNPNAVTGQTKGLSTIDIRKLNKMYKCA